MPAQSNEVQQSIPLRQIAWYELLWQAWPQTAADSSQNIKQGCLTYSLKENVTAKKYYRPFKIASNISHIVYFKTKTLF